MADATVTTGQTRSTSRHWPTWVFFVAFLLVSVESVLVAIVFKGTLLVLLAPGAVCWMKAMELWKVVRRELDL